MAERVLHLSKRRASVTQGNLLARSVQQQMTVYENRLIYVAMASISQGQTDFLTTEIPITGLESLLGVNSKMLYRIARDTAQSLLERTVVIGSDAEGWADSPWFSRVGYVPAHKHPKRVSTIQLAFHKDLKPYLLPYLLKEQDDFNTIPLGELLSIPTFTSARIFEVFYHDSFGGRKGLLTYEIEDLKKRIGLEGKYAKFGDFRYVLERARVDLTTYTSMTFSYVGIQRGRGVTQIRFQVTPNTSFLPLTKEPQPRVGGSEDVEIDDDFFELEYDLKAAGYKKDASALIARYGVDRVRSNLLSAQRKAREAAATSSPVRNFGKLVDYMIQNDIAGTAEQAAEGGAQALSPHKLRQLATLLKDSFEVDLRGAGARVKAAMSEAELDDLHDIMRVEMGEFALAQLDRCGWQGATYEAALSTVLCHKQRFLFPEHYGSLASWTEHEKIFDEYSPEDRSQIIRAAQALLQV
jgi:plasmid replication initiation protein